jgi:acyl carrier protein
MAFPGEHTENTEAPLVTTGARWNSLRKVYAGTNGAVAELVISTEYSGDLVEMAVHPALLDIGTGLVQYLGRKGNYLPLAYERITVIKPMTVRMYIHMEINRTGLTDGDMISCNVHVMDEKGSALIEVDGFTMRKLSGEALAGLKNASAATLHNLAGSPEDIRTNALAAAVSEEAGSAWKAPDVASAPGIAVKEGQEAFGRILSGFTLPQVIVSSRDINTVIREADTSDEEEIVEKFAYPGLQRPVHARPELGSSYVAPGNELEQKVAQIWQKVLGIDRVGLDDNFFELGGSSLSGIQVVSEIKKAFGADISTVSIFEAPTVSLFTGLLVPGGGKQMFDKARDRAEKKKEALSRRTVNMRRGKKQL